MQIDALKGGAEGIYNVMENQRVHEVDRQPTEQDQNKMARPEANANAANTQTGVAVQGLGENVDLMV